MVYPMLRDYVTIRHGGDAAAENGHGALYLPQKAVLRHMPEDEDKSSVLTIQQELMMLFGIDLEDFSIIPPKGSTPYQIYEMIRRKYPNQHNYLFEGYAVSSEHEGADFHAQLVNIMLDDGKYVLWSIPTKVDLWNNKTHFRSWISQVYGQGAVPPGVHLDAEAVSHEVVCDWVEKKLRLCKKIILKRNNGGGFGNLIINSEDEYFTALTEFVDTTLKENSWLSLETWVPWTQSGCCSGFILNDGSFEPVAVVEQILSEKTAGFIGSRFTDLDELDQNTLFDCLAFFARTLHKDGVRGFAGFDFIILDDCVLPELGLKLPSGKRFMFIEATPRVGGHNQELRFLNLVESLWSAYPLFHIRVGTPHWGGRAKAREVIGNALQMPYLLDQQSEDKALGFFLDGHLSTGPTIYDSVILVGLDQSLLMEKLALLQVHRLTR